MSCAAIHSGGYVRVWEATASDDIGGPPVRANVDAMKTQQDPNEKKVEGAEVAEGAASAGENAAGEGAAATAEGGEGGGGNDDDEEGGEDDGDED